MSIRTRQYVSAVIAQGNVLLLILLRYQQEIRDAGDLSLPGTPDELGVTKKELKMARMLVEAMESRWDPSEHHDEHREKLMQWIESKIESGDIACGPETAEIEATPKSITIMEALKKSVEGEAPGGPGKKKPKKRAG